MKTQVAGSRSRWLVGVFVLTGLGCHSPAPPPGPVEVQGPSRGGTAVLGSISDVDSWNEYTSRQDFAAKLHRRLFLRLAREQGDGQTGPASYEPQLAESWTLSDDGRSLTFRLRPARWSDGKPITAADVRFTWTAQTASDVAWVGVTAKDHVADVEVLDESTVTFHFDSVYPHQLADAVEGGILPEHVYGEIPFEQWRTYDWSKLTVGSGPFLLERYEPGHEIVLRRNSRYFREGLPYLDKVVIRIVPDEGNLVTQLRSGDIDYFEGLAPRDASRLSSDRDISLVSFDYPKYDYIGWNGSKPPFDDSRLRKALTLGIDRAGLVEELLYGFGRISKGPLLSFWWSANRDLDPWPYDPEQARSILAELGYDTRNDDGSTVDRGKPLELELITNAGNRLREAMTVKIQEQLSRVGVVVHLRTLEMKTLVGRCMSGDFDAYLGGWTLLGKPDLKPIFGSEFTPPRGANVVHYDSPEIDRLLARLEQAADWQAMKQVFDEIQQRIHLDQPYTFLYETKRVAAYGPRLVGMQIDIPSDPLARLETAFVR